MDTILWYIDRLVRDAPEWIFTPEFPRQPVRLVDVELEIEQR